VSAAIRRQSSAWKWNGFDAGLPLCLWKGQLDENCNSMRQQRRFAMLKSGRPASETTISASREVSVESGSGGPSGLPWMSATQAQ